MTDRNETVGFGALCLGVGLMVGTLVPYRVAFGVGVVYVVCAFAVGVTND